MRGPVALKIKQRLEGAGPRFHELPCPASPSLNRTGNLEVGAECVWRLHCGSVRNVLCRRAKEKGFFPAATYRQPSGFPTRTRVCCPGEKRSAASATPTLELCLPFRLSHIHSGCAQVRQFGSRTPDPTNGPISFITSATCSSSPAIEYIVRWPVKNALPMGLAAAARSSQNERRSRTGSRTWFRSKSAAEGTLYFLPCWKQNLPTPIIGSAGGGFRESDRAQARHKERTTQ